ncbi:MAG: hypothetical protein E6I51_08205 [Chloroflexi bacterium]|nr:MAG: hypothetical protein E6I51_08205 [Chloroflexota bacterium]
MKRARRIDPLYVVATILTIAVLGLAVLVGANAQGQRRTASVFDQTSGGASDLRALVEALGARTVILQGERFAPRESGASVVFLLGATEFVDEEDVTAARAFLQNGGTLVVATDAGFAETALLRAFGADLSGRALSSEYDTTSVLAAPARANRIVLDRGATLNLGDRWSPVARVGEQTIAAMTREGRGTVVLVSSLAPFVNALLGEGDNSRFALSLAASGFGAGHSVGFDEYHHGAHPSPELLAVLERTWLGRALLVVAGIVFVYLLWSGRRFGPPLPADPRPPRSSLDYVRGFAGLVRRSGRDEIARDRLRRDLRVGLAARYGLDPTTGFDRVLATADANEPTVAAEARAIDAALTRRLRDAELLRTVARIERVVAKREAV